MRKALLAALAASPIVLALADLMGTNTWTWGG